MKRDLTAIEKTNQEFIDSFTLNSVNLLLTETGFKKSIMDATYAVRLFFESNNLHIYKTQEVGPEYKTYLNAHYYFECSFVKTRISLYRPITKNGDPRLWFNDLKKDKCLPNSCVFSIVFSLGEIYIFNISNPDFISDFKKCELLRSKLVALQENEESVAKELFDMIYTLYKRGWVPTVGKGDKAVGETLEHVLGIEANCSKSPDYKGIELKAGRKGKAGRKESRVSLFAQVASWKLSAVSSSKEMLEKYGYFRDGKYRLNCTVSSKNINSLGLTFVIDEKKEELHEVHVENSKTSSCLIWPFDILVERLKTKHNETFWVEAETRLDANGNEEFLYTKIIHTKKPFLGKLIPLIQDGTISMDHLISAKEGKSASERGPLFKLDKKNLNLLFPEPNVIDLKSYKD